MDRGSRCVRVVWVAGFVSLLLMVGTVPARAAFPGANGLLVVQPDNGRGLLLVGQDGASPQQICSAGTRCAGARDPVWSPDGSVFAVSVRHRTSVVYADGSCFACSLPEPVNSYSGSSDPTFDPGFLPDGRLVVGDPYFNSDSGLFVMKTDGAGLRGPPVSGFWRQPAWSARGQLAAVRRVKRKSEVFVIDPRTGKARQVTRGGASSPSWSPDGRRLAVVEGGWIALVSARGGRLRRLTRGGAPAWAPNGKELAFVGAHHRLFVIAVRGGAPRAVGHIRAVRVDWQPVTGKPPTPCQAPAGSRVLAATPNATITIDGSASIGQALSVLGCLASDGHERLLESLPSSGDAGVPGIGSVAIAGDYVALVNNYSDAHYATAQDWLAAFDLQTGTAISSGAEAECPFPGPACRPSPDSFGMDQVAVSDVDGANAAHTFVLNPDVNDTNCTLAEQIVATDSTGTHTLDSITTKAPCHGPPPPTQLSQLSISGHTLTWSHGGSPRSAELN